MMQRERGGWAPYITRRFGIPPSKTLWQTTNTNEVLEQLLLYRGLG